MNLKIFIFISSYLICSNVFGQTTKVEVKPCSNSSVECVGDADTLKNYCVKVIPKAGATPKYKLDWGDGKTEDINITAETQFNHIYDLRNFLKDCNKSTTDPPFTIKATNIDFRDDNVSFDLYFDKKPKAEPIVKQACEGQSIQFDNNSCPRGGDITYKWEFSDGRISNSSIPNLSFTDPTKNYTGTLTSTTKNCGSNSKSFNFSLEKKPQPKMSFSGFTIANTDTVFCQENGAIISLDATTSLNSSSYSWSITGGSYSVVTGNTSTGTVKIKFDESKVYTITLTARNSCGTVSAAPCRHRVVAKPPFNIANQLDQCTAFDYKIPNPFGGATYTLNSTSFGSSEVKNLPISTSPYIVKGELKYECGIIADTDTFLVKTIEQAKFSNFKDTTICVGTNPLNINANPQGGTWFGNNLTKNGATAIFNPQTIGSFDITYKVGSGSCASEVKSKIDVKGVTINTSDISVCAGQSNIKLLATPIGGNWSSPGCSNCLLGDTVLVSSISGNSQDFVYKISSDVGGAICQSEKKIVLNKGNPIADFNLSGGCVGQIAQIGNNSNGATSYEWYLNGSSQTASTSLNPNNVVLPAGNVTLKLVAKAGQCKSEKSKSITVGTPPENFDITMDKTNGCSPLSVSFSSSAPQRTDVAYDWDFGNSNKSSSFSNTHVFNNQTYGNITYTIVLKAKNDCDTKTATKTIEVFPLVKSQIGVDSTIYRCGPATVKLSNRSLGKVGSSTWYFGDGTNLSSSLDTLSHFFSAGLNTKVFTISLISQNGCGQDTSFQDITVFPEKITPYFNMDKFEACVGEIVKFKDATTPLPNNWNWKVDGKIFALTDSTQYAFSAPKDEYLITMIAKTSCGSDSLSRKIKVKPPPDSNFRLIENRVCEGQKIRLENLSPNANSFVWDFGENGTLDSLNYSTEFLYQSSGEKKVKLTVYGNTKACKNSLEKSLIIRPKPQVDFGLESDSTFFCETEFFQLISKSTNGNKYTWFADEVILGTGIKIDQKLSNGSYDIKLKVENEDGCLDSLTKANFLNINACEFRMPEVFTPNGDGIGEYFTLSATDGIEKILRLRIRDRWGEIIFDKKDFKPNLLSEGWDGTFNGKEMPSGIYTYEIELSKKGGGLFKNKNYGTFTLLR